jgi:hypothetical protein
MPNGAVVEMIVVEVVDKEALEAAVKWALVQLATGAAQQVGAKAGGDIYDYVKRHLTHNKVKHEHKRAHPSDVPGKAYYHHKG